MFKTLSALSPGRIDFGVGRAAGGDQHSIYALTEGRQPIVNNMYEKLDIALQLINDEVMICSIPHSQEKRLDVYRLLAREMLG